MKKFLKLFLFSILGIIVSFLLLTLFLSDKYIVEKSINISGDNEKIFNEIADFHTWQNWNPWMTTDSTMINSFTIDTNYIGSKWKWDSKILGIGEVTILKVNKPKFIQSKLHFILPKESVVIEEWKVEQIDAKQVKVSWKHSGELNYPFGRFLGLWATNILEPSFEKGLKKLKNILEQKEN